MGIFIDYYEMLVFVYGIVLIRFEGSKCYDWICYEVEYVFM